MDDFLKITRPNPSAKYDVLDDWSKKFDGKRGKFLKSEKVTHTEEIMKNSKKHRPCPGYYKFKAPSEETKGFSKKGFSNEHKGCCFIDEQKRLAVQTPGTKYNIKDELL